MYVYITIQVVCIYTSRCFNGAGDVVISVVVCIVYDIILYIAETMYYSINVLIEGI